MTTTMTPQKASDGDGYCRWCKRMVYLYEEGPGQPTIAREFLGKHAPDCPVSIGAQQERERLRGPMQAIMDIGQEQAAYEQGAQQERERVVPLVKDLRDWWEGAEAMAAREFGPGPDIEKRKARIAAYLADPEDDQGV